MKRMLRRSLLAVMALAPLAWAAGRAEAGTAFTIDDTTGLGLGNPPFTLGFQFTANSAITVTQLGLFDDSLDGFVESHEIGLFDSDGNLLVSSTIDAGTVDPLTNQFRYVSVAATTLTAGATYTIGALYTSGVDALIFPGGATNFATDPAITFNQASFAFGSSLSFPGASGGGDPAYFGPNFQFGAVPEPATLVMSGMAGVVGLGDWLRRRKSEVA